MVSLKRLINASEEETALRKVVALLLEKIGSCAAEGERAALDTFRGEMTEMREHIVREVAPEALFVSAGSAVKAMENYNRQISALLRRQSGELQSIVSMIAETARKIGGENTRSAQRLQEIGDKFERAGGLDDLPALKSHLSDCLHTFREETKRQKAESDAVIQTLQKEVGRLHENPASPVSDDRDPVTGLPRQTAGLRAMQEAMKAGKHVYVLTMVVNRIQSINARYGFETGDRILRMFKERVEGNLTRADQLFRWAGPAVVVLLDRAETVEQVRAQIRRMLDTRMEESFEAEGRSVSIPLSAAWSLFPLMPPAVLAVKQIQSFIASQGGQDAV